MDRWPEGFRDIRCGVAQHHETLRIAKGSCQAVPCP